jgi:hypothetical protein
LASKLIITIPGRAENYIMERIELHNLIYFPAPPAKNSRHRRRRRRDDGKISEIK